MQTDKMPLIFAGHGSPMNAVIKNNFTEEMSHFMDGISKPRAILMISAHWYTDGTFIQSASEPKQIYDFSGFPEELYKVRYPVSGYSPLTERVRELLGDKVKINDEWGIDHGAWSVLIHMIPDHSIPVVQLSVDFRKSFQEHFEIGKLLKPLREEGILVMSSGNILHNLRKVNWQSDTMSEDGRRFDDAVGEIIMSGNYDDILKIRNNPLYKYAVPTPDHFIPLLYILGAAEKNESIEVLNKSGELDTISMTSYIFGRK